MSTTLTNGLKLPDKGSVDWYADMQNNYTILDGAVGTVAEHTTQIAGKASLVHTHGKADITDFPAYGNTAGTICEGNDSRLSDARTPVAHTHTKSDVTDLLNSNFIPSANNSYDLGSSSYQWNNLYAKNYYYNGVAWGLNKANVWSQAQFYSQNSIHVRNVEPGVAPSSDVIAGIKFENANANYVFADIVGKVFTSGTTFVNLIASNKYSNGALDPNGTTVSKNLQIGVRGNGTGFIYTDCGWRCNLVPPLAESGIYSLGTSTNKWKTLNGINPGALSLPNFSNADPVDTRNWVASTPTNNAYTPSENGWLNIVVADSSPSANEFSLYVKSTNFFASAVHKLGDIDDSKGKVGLFIPVIAGITYYVVVKGSVSNVTISATFFPCFGSV